MKPISQINVIPFIDIMLVLLAIVLTTATFIAQGTIPVSLPRAQHGVSLNESKSIEITITHEGRYYWQEQIVLSEELDTRLRDLSKDTHLLLKVDASSKFDSFVNVVDRLKGHQLSNISIVTENY